MAVHKEIDTGFEADPQVYQDFLDETTSQFDRGFEELRRIESALTVVDIVQKDEVRIPGVTLIGFLKTEHGGKPERGAEKIEVLVKALYPELSLQEMAELMQIAEPDQPLFNTNEAFVVHQDSLGSKRFVRVNGQGVYPWVPFTQAILQPDTIISDLDIVSWLDLASSGQAGQADRDRLASVNQAYVLDLIPKVAGWPFVPQN